MFNLKLYFTAKPNGQLLHLIPTSSFRKMSAARKSVCMWARGCTLTINNYFIWSNFRFATPFFFRYLIFMCKTGVQTYYTGIPDAIISLCNDSFI